MKKSLKIFYLILLLLLNIRVVLYSQLENMRFENISTDKGLSYVSVNCIAQDRKGFLWVGTQMGLNRYDGYNMKIYRPDQNDSNSLSGDWITAICVDKSDVIWIGTLDAGLNKYDKKKNKWTRYYNNPSNSNSLINNSIKSIFEDKNGNGKYDRSEKGVQSVVLTLEDGKKATTDGSRRDSFPAFA